MAQASKFTTSNDATGTEKRRRISGTSRDTSFQYLVKEDPGLEEWRQWASEWVKSGVDDIATAMASLKVFFIDYLLTLGLPKDPRDFFNMYSAPDMFNSALERFTSPGDKIRRFYKIKQFLAYVLDHGFSLENDIGEIIPLFGFRDPVPERPGDIKIKNKNTDSNKNLLPYHHIVSVRQILTPVDAENFSDWKWAQGASETADWFDVPVSLIDKTDPDCVWRTTLTGKKKNIVRYQMWFPGRAVALMTKLELPLRTYQVRMLDSGEADTMRYDGGKWKESVSPHTKGSRKYIYQRGVFRMMRDVATGNVITGLFINTNKTADKDKPEDFRGYEIPWQHKIALKWFEKLRNWQEKYNPISGPSKWTELDAKHFGKPKAQHILEKMGSCCFLFRDPTKISEKNLPIRENSLELMWYKLLSEYEARFKKANPAIDIQFTVPGTKITCFYTLHSLRVSLITAFALDGGVPLEILSKCIAGHARILMTLHYVKMGPEFVTERMVEAELKLQEKSQGRFFAWLKKAPADVVRSAGAFISNDAVDSICSGQESGASLCRDEKGICTKGRVGCHNGGILVSQNSGKAEYGPVPGYPEKNCVQCRWFFTGPAFLPGLVKYWNLLQTKMGEIADHIIQLEDRVIELENIEFNCDQKNMIFSEKDVLDFNRRLVEQAIEKNDQFACGLLSTLRLIMRSIDLANAGNSNGLDLMTIGTIGEARISISECEKLQQILQCIEDSAIIPEVERVQSFLAAGKAYDLMLACNGKQPIFFSLDDKYFSIAVKQMTSILKAELGSIKNAIPFVEGMRKFQEIGITAGIEKFIENCMHIEEKPYSFQALALVEK
jgi:hypothetical protein